MIGKKYSLPDDTTRPNRPKGGWGIGRRKEFSYKKLGLYGLFAAMAVGMVGLCKVAIDQSSKGYKLEKQLENSRLKPENYYTREEIDQRLGKFAKSSDISDF